MTYDVYHDESTQAGYWHGILLVPQSSRTKVLAHMATIRQKTHFDLPLSLKEVKSGGDRFQCSRAAVQLAVLSLMQDTKGTAESVWMSKRCFDAQEARTATEFLKILRISEPLGLRFIVFRERDCHEFLDPAGDFLDHGGKVETTFRMGITYGLHLMFDETSPMTISSIHFDGHQHYQRHVDKDRVVGRLKQRLRDYCQVDEKVFINDYPSDHRRADAQPYDDCQLLQLADLLIGSFRTVLADQKNEFQAQIAQPVAGLVDKWKCGRKRMEYSRWHRGFCISQCHLENEKWRFTQLPAKEIPDQPYLPL